MTNQGARQDVASQGHRRTLRGVTAGAAATGIVVAVLWSVGVPNAAWFRAGQQQTSPITLSAEEPKLAPSAKQVPTLDGRLHLVSTAPGRNVREGTAELGEDLANPQTFAAGAVLENGATLLEIYADHVVIERDGQTTELYVEGIALGPSVKKIPKVNAALVSLDTAPTAAPPVPSPPTYTDVVRGAPRFEEDQIVGFDMYPGTNREHFARLGMQPGDVLTSLDGVPMNSTEALHSALQSIRDGRAVSAIVIRKGQSISVSLDAPGPALHASAAGIEH